MTKRKVAVINCAPTPEGYAHLLLLVYTDHPDPIKRSWALSEIIKVFRVAATVNPERWGKETK